MRSVRAIAATIVAVRIFHCTISLSAHTVKNVQYEGRIHEGARAVESAVAYDRFATHVEELKT
jgi:hypothetical protein